MLIIVPSPIGHLGDMTYRAIQALKDADVILCEDTRKSGILLKHYQISKPLLAHHQHNEHRLVPRLIEELKGGKKMALLTDAGTPAISDPGFLLVRACRQNNIPVICLPGATAFVPALVQSGLPASSFVFEGFLPLKKGRHTKLTQLADEERTIIFYESPHRLLKTLNELTTYFGEDRPVAVCRELTKLFEETFTGTLAEAHSHFGIKGVKGEIVVVLGGRN